MVSLKSVITNSYQCGRSLMETLTNIIQVETIQSGFNFGEQNNGCLRLIDFAAASFLVLRTSFCKIASCLYTYKSVSSKSETGSMLVKKQ